MCSYLQKNTVKTLFGGVITNNVVSLVSLRSLISSESPQRSNQSIDLEFTVLQDCDHVSQTAEEFYTVRCQVADMKNIYVSKDAFFSTTRQKPSAKTRLDCVCGPDSGVSG